MPKIKFKADVFSIGSRTIIKLPASASGQLPSRGMVMVEGTLNGKPFQAALEPDGRGSHWFSPDKAAGISGGDRAELDIEVSKQWPEPKLPSDLQSALKSAKPHVRQLWTDITPMARWDWLRWIASTGNSETRARRIDVAFSKLEKGTRRPCCFNRSACTVPEVSKNGALLEPVPA